MDFKWLPGKVGTPVIAPPKAPDEPPIVGVIVPPGTDITLRTVHSTWQGAAAATIVTSLLPAVGIDPKSALAKILIGLVAGALAFIRSWLSHRRQAKA